MYDISCQVRRFENDNNLSTRTKTGLDAKTTISVTKSLQSAGKYSKIVHTVTPQRLYWWKVRHQDLQLTEGETSWSEF